jgi:hypothetical protein
MSRSVSLRRIHYNDEVLGKTDANDNQREDEYLAQAPDII